MAGTEAEQLTAALDRLRTTFRFKADGLDAAGLNQSVGASTLTLGGLLKHLALVEDHQFSTKLTGAPLGDPWAAIDWDADPSWEFTSAAGVAEAGGTRIVGTRRLTAVAGLSWRPRSPTAGRSSWSRVSSGHSARPGSVAR